MALGLGRDPEKKGNNRMTILVTGGAGFIGAHFILDWFEKQNEPLINVDILTYAAKPSHLDKLKSNPNYHFIQADIADTALILDILRQHQVRAIVHFAAESHVDLSILNPEIFMQTNIIGTFRLLEAAHAYWQPLDFYQKQDFRFLHVSTDEVYGSLDFVEPAFTELRAYQPNNPYSASKAASDHLVRSYFHTYGLPTLTTHCSNNYGPFQHAEKLIPLCIQRALSGASLPIYGDGRQVRDWLYVRDHCAALALVLDRGVVGETYNIGGGNEKTNLQVARAICSLLDELKPHRSGRSYLSLITYVTDRPGHDRRYAMDASKISRLLGFQPKESFDSGIRKTVLWFMAQVVKEKIALMEEHWS